MMLVHSRKRLITSLASLMTLTLAAGPALADPGKHRRHHHDGYDRGHDRHHDRHYRGDRHDRRHSRRHYRRSHRGYPVYVHGRDGRYADRRSEQYYCGPCKRSFRGHDHLSRHVHRRHHVPLWKLPFVIVHSVVGGFFGWIFHG